MRLTRYCDQHLQIDNRLELSHDNINRAVVVSSTEELFVPAVSYTNSPHTVKHGDQRLGLFERVGTTDLYGFIAFIVACRRE